MRRGSIFLLFVLLCAVLSFRSGTDVEDQAFALNLGLDIDSDGMMLITLQMPASGKTEEQTTSGAGGAYQVVQARGHTYHDALQVLGASIPRDVNFSQLLQIIVSRNLASDPSFPYVLEGVLSTLRIRQSASLAVARHSAAEIIENQQAFLGVRLSTDIQTTLDVFSEGGSVPESQLGQVQRLMDGAWRTAVVPYVGLNESGMQNPDSAAGRPLDGVAGSLAYEGENEVEYLGAVLLDRTGMVGELTGMEMRFLAFVQGSMKQFIFRVDDAYYLVEQNFRPRLRVSRSWEAWTLQVEGGITAYPRSRERVGETRVSEAFAAEVLHVLEKLRDLGVDPVGFEGIAVRSSPTLDAWAQEGWERQYRDSSIEVSIRAAVHYGN